MRSNNDPNPMVPLANALDLPVTANRNYIADFDWILEKRKEKREMTFDVVWKILIFWVLLMIAFLIKDLKAADLKCVTIKFKNDSELKLKTQWFVNAPTTKINCGWSAVATDNYETTVAFYEKKGLQIRESPEYKKYGYFELYSCDTLLLDRILLFPPDVRKEPVIKTKESKDGKGWIIMAGESVPYDTTEGEALLWYEKRRKDER